MMKFFFFLYAGNGAVIVGWFAREAFLEGSTGIGIVLSFFCAVLIAAIWTVLK